MRKQRKDALLLNNGRRYIFKHPVFLFKGEIPLDLDGFESLAAAWNMVFGGGVVDQVNREAQDYGGTEDALHHCHATQFSQDLVDLVPIGGLIG